ncbi:hypothetical protein A3C23_04505 [Candidatus Roizmanbacteria bacterium RIFCSPHIGHO2_02_FULL_37_13b]|uniref:Phage-Barnase-EndoU-ColicinE5/D-RelE like nuclease 2 domain-containing protein n=1 Tax=Candidatus Roizmanbacteria bacterium RIFCSPLOWO2_02_FULL_36_11 TaxID=1802071 RepID=A0A1F7JH81_9BACT|nr:MAG: hypothetical protein A3C23_04505 [Candidatus Roizmanbacteria bacterium RIFCSPHIGHO2_02_FULL_37_13b]OGK54969.1 MAG: hypothetical protein A3H78_00650 [Candidatus Roizmanbacteria bacterium RIFCSPLOWO2_02_FULL_36_11]
MKKTINKTGVLFEVTDVLGRKIRTTKTYWKKIKEIKHTEFKLGISEVKKTLICPEEIRKSVTDTTVLVFVKKINKNAILVVVVKVLNGEGFLVTTYQTYKYKKKGESIWQKQKVKK